MQRNSTGALRLCGIKQRAILTAAVVTALGGAYATNAYGQTAVTWDGTTGSYTEPTNWNPDTTPSNTASPMQFLTINNGGTAQIVTGDNAEGPLLYIGLQPGDIGHLTIDGGTFNVGEMRVGGLESIPDLVTPTNPPTLNGGGTGTVVQNGGTVNITAVPSSDPPRQSLWVGDAGLESGNTANGSYTITGTSLAPAVLNNGIAANDGIFIGTGVGTVGTFTQNAFTTVTTTGFVNVGRRGANGTYTMNDGVLNAQGASGGISLFVGDGDTTGIQTTSGTFTQNAGTVNLAQNANIGRRGGDGFYNMNGGTLNQTAGTIIIGDGATVAAAPGTNGTFTQTAGDVNAAAVTVAQLSGTGVYAMSGGTLDIAGAFTVGSVGSVSPGLLNANGTLNLSGGDITVGTNLNMAFGSSTVQTNGVGTINMTGGSILLNGTGTTIFAVGNGLGTSATANLSAGTITHTAGSAANFNIGRNNGSGVVNVSGTHTLNAKMMTLDSTNVVATRTLNISGGTVDVDTLTFGTLPSQSTRLLDISGGTVNIGTLSTGQATGAGQALTHIRGGTVTLENVVTFFSGSTFRLSAINLAVPANSTYGNANIDVLSGSTLTLNGTFGTGSDARTLTKTGPGALTVNGAQSYATNAVANINGGTVNYNTNVGAGMNDADVANLAITVDGSGSAANFGSNQKLRSLTVNSGAVATVVGDATDKTLRSAAVTVNSGAKLDMADNDMIVDFVAGPSPEFALRDKALLFRNGAGTEGIGFTETVAEDVVLAFADAGEMAITSFNGFTIDNTTVVGKYTYYGDGNLDGQVTTDDYVAVDLGLGTGDSWNQGDFDLNGVVTTDDYVVVDLNLGKGTGNPLAFAEEQARMIALHTEMFGQSYVEKLAYASEFGWVAASVPEPGALSLVGLGAMAMLGRRRRSR